MWQPTFYIKLLKLIFCFQGDTLISLLLRCCHLPNSSRCDQTEFERARVGAAVIFAEHALYYAYRMVVSAGHDTKANKPHFFLTDFLSANLVRGQFQDFLPWPKTAKLLELAAVVQSL